MEREMTAQENYRRMCEDSDIADAARKAGLVVDGKLRTILGTLPVTADGCVIGSDYELFGLFDPGTESKHMKKPYIIPAFSHHPIDLQKVHRLQPGGEYIIDMTGIGYRWIGFYATREAAEAAKGGGDAQP